MHQIIYINNKPLILTDSSEEIRANFQGSSEFYHLVGSDKENFNKATDYLNLTGTLGVVMQGETLSDLVQKAENTYTTIEAGGGVVFNPEKEVLMIFRKGKWDLPKGKLDEGETIEECALREVKEETGIQQLTLTGKICNTYHLYTQNNHDFLKKTYWYKMFAYDLSLLIPQVEEDITEARWITVSEINRYLSQSYLAIKEVINKALATYD